MTFHTISMCWTEIFSISFRTVPDRVRQKACQQMRFGFAQNRADIDIYLYIDISMADIYLGRYRETNWKKFTCNNNKIFFFSGTRTLIWRLWKRKLLGPAEGMCVALASINTAYLRWTCGEKSGGTGSNRKTISELESGWIFGSLNYRHAPIKVV